MVHWWLINGPYWKGIISFPETLVQKLESIHSWRGQRRIHCWFLTSSRTFTQRRAKMWRTTKQHDTRVVVYCQWWTSGFTIHLSGCLCTSFHRRPAFLHRSPPTRVKHGSFGTKESLLFEVWKDQCVFQCFLWIAQPTYESINSWWVLKTCQESPQADQYGYPKWIFITLLASIIKYQSYNIMLVSGFAGTIWYTNSWTWVVCYDMHMQRNNTTMTVFLKP